MKFRIPPHKNISLGRDIVLGSQTIIEVEEQATLSIGDGTKITGYTLISSSGHIAIGSECLIAEYVSIRDSNHGINSLQPIAKQPLDKGYVRIGNDVWIGRGAAILKDVTIANGCVIGANSVVTRDIAVNSVVVGVPAKVIKRRFAL